MLKRFLNRPLLLILIFGFFLYLPSLNGKFLWDDEDFVYANRYVQNFDIDSLFTQSLTSGREKESNYFRPVQGIIYSSIYQVAGPNPFWFHLVNVLAHIGATCAIFGFFNLVIARSETTKQSHESKGKIAPSVAKLFPQSDNLIPLLASLVFLIHPVQTEAVSYISGLSDPLYVTFGFLSLFFYLLKNERKNMVPLSLFFFVLALLSKETGLVFLPILLLLVFVTETKVLTTNLSNFKKTLETFLSKIVSLWPYLLSTSGYLLYHFTFINNFNIKTAWGNTPYANHTTIRLLTFVQNLFTYIQILIFPKDLFMERDFSTPIQTSFLNPYFIIFIASIILGLVLSWRFRKKILTTNHYPRVPILIFCFFAFFVSFIPYTGIVLINGIFYEHFLYLPLIFFFAFWVILLEPLARKHSKVFMIFLLFVFSLLLWRNISRQLEWANPIKFYSQTLSYAPKSIRIINGLGIAYFEKNDTKMAIETYEKGIKLNPDIPNLYHNLANVYLSLDQIESAEKYYLKAIEVDPNFIFSWQYLTNIYKATNQDEKLKSLILRYNEK